MQIMAWHRPSGGVASGSDGGFGCDWAGAGGGAEWCAGGGLGAEACAAGTGDGDGGGGAVRCAATRVPTTTKRWLFWCFGWQANSVIVGSGVWLAIQVESGVTTKDFVTAYTKRPDPVVKITWSPGASRSR